MLLGKLDVPDGSPRVQVDALCDPVNRNADGADSKFDDSRLVMLGEESDDAVHFLFNCSIEVS